MQYKIWLDDTNHFTINAQLSHVGNDGPDNRPEVVAALVTDAQLSDIKIDEVLDLIGQCIDHLTTHQQKHSPQRDWRDEWMERTRQ